MSKQQKGLGKGISALFGDTADLGNIRKPVGYINKEVVSEELPRESGPKADVLLIPVDMIEPNPFQPRMTFDQEALEELEAAANAPVVTEEEIVEEVIEVTHEEVVETAVPEESDEAVTPSEGETEELEEEVEYDDEEYDEEEVDYDEDGEDEEEGYEEDDYEEEN